MYGSFKSRGDDPLDISSSMLGKRIGPPEAFELIVRADMSMDVPGWTEPYFGLLELVPYWLLPAINAFESTHLSFSATDL